MALEELKELEMIIWELRGYFQAQKDKLIKDNAMRMLDKLEIILKKKIEN
ncbi:hypothetical protein LCGC14_3053290 [marine sediment metagenome]|uniref:Uncharacterized protein n=1 Tax=marine sediment metagenome TaxID=412755 RepID=A0A0F8YTX2_9ZZZZ